VATTLGSDAAAAAASCGPDGDRAAGAALSGTGLDACVAATLFDWNSSSIGRNAAYNKSPKGLRVIGVVGSAGATGFRPTIVSTSEIAVAATPMGLRGGGVAATTWVVEVTGKLAFESGDEEIVDDAVAVIAPPAAVVIAAGLIDSPVGARRPSDGGVAVAEVAAVVFEPSCAVGG